MAATSIILDDRGQPYPTEQRATLRNPPKWLMDAVTGGTSGNAAGEVVNESTALTLDTYFACIGNIASDVGKMPLITYRRVDGGKDRATENPIYRLLHDAPNSEMTSIVFRETMTAHAIGWGNGYAEIERRRNGEPVALWPIDPTTVQLERRDDGTPRGRLVYVVRSDMVSPVDLPAENVLHLHGLGYDGNLGYSVPRLAREIIGAALAAHKFSGAFFGNGASLGGVLQHPGSLTDKALEHLRQSWNARHAGGENAHKTAILEEGMSYNKLAIDPENAQLVETREFNVEAVCRYFRMPPHKVGHLKRAVGWSTLEATNQDYLTDTLMPWLRRWEQELNRRLFRDPTLFAEHEYKALLQPDHTTRKDFYTAMMRLGIMNRNEIRGLENLNSIGEDGDVYFVSADMVPVDTLINPPDPPAQEQPPTFGEPEEDEDVEDEPTAEPDEEQDDEEAGRMLRRLAVGYIPLLESVYTRRRELAADKITRARKRYEGRKSGLAGWMRKFLAEHIDEMRIALIPVVDAYAVSAWQVLYGVPMEHDSEIRLAAHVAAMAERRVATMRLDRPPTAEVEARDEMERLIRFLEDLGRQACVG